mgnify:FL=1
MNNGFEQTFEGLQVNLRLPDLWQQEAVRAIRNGEDVVLSAPTGAGKTYVFENLIDNDKSFSASKQAVYTVPTRALANDKWREWTKAGWKVGIATGDLAENLDAPVIVATLETQREKLLSGQQAPGLLVIDEYQMIGDRIRGLNYELAIALAPADTRLLLLSGSVGNPKRIAEWLKRLGRNARVVSTLERPVPLDEIPLEALPNQAPRKYSNFWQRLALGTLLSHYGPLLIFAPHRKAAEKIAWKVAEAFPDDNPIQLGKGELEQAASHDLSRLLRKRVAYHHSGLSFFERGGIVEPLAKAGQLRVVVATMGLAAGINFSVRSVFVSDTTYQDGPFKRDVSPDELLQMFGRAGRRGLDETGYIISGHKSPRLGDAHPLELRRQNEIDWPTMIRRMHHAEENGDSPFEAARELRDHLFSQQRIPLGFRSGEEETESKNESEPLFGLKPLRKEILNGKEEWEPTSPGRETTVPLSQALCHVRGCYRDAESSSNLIASLLPKRSRLTRLDGKGRGPRRYGLEIAVATAEVNDTFRLTQFARQLAGEKNDKQTYSFEEVEILLPEVFASHIAPAEFEAIQQRGRQLYLTGHFRNAAINVYLDTNDLALHEPVTRSVEIESETYYTDSESGNMIDPKVGTPAHGWRKLGLISDRGGPTARGLIFSLFQGGEGLTIAAALEDPHYPMEELVLHLANLRGGHRFELDTVVGGDSLLESIGSERLATASRQTYGSVDYEGYLQFGLPPGYGESAAEVIDLMLNGQLGQLLGKSAQLKFGSGDIERCYVEWLSLLRHIQHAPNLENERWNELKVAASKELKRHDRRNPLATMPDLPASVLQKHPQNSINYKML